VLEAGAYEIPSSINLFGRRKPVVEIQTVDVRQRELTIKGQEILSADKVALRVSIIVQFRVHDARAAVQEVEDFEERLYSDVQLAARRSLASMQLEQILTNRNQLSEDILADVKEIAATYGVTIFRADVKDLSFPGNLQEIMNKVLAAERMSQAQLVEARTRAQTQQIDAEARAEVEKINADTQANATRVQAAAQAERRRMTAQAEFDALKQLEGVAAQMASNPALLRLRELDSIKELAKNANARIYFSHDRMTDRDE
jgi:regulator of protease activity HflC (stomatin/prohibitin superfamily)